MERRISPAQQFANDHAKTPKTDPSDPKYRAHVFNRMPYEKIDRNARPTLETRKQSDRLFNQAKRKSLINGYKQQDKRLFMQQLFHAAKRAAYVNGCVAVSRKPGKYGCSTIGLQVVDVLVEAKMLMEIRSKKGSPKMSRYVPTEKFKRAITLEPDSIEPDENERFVRLYSRTRPKIELPIDETDETFLDCQTRLKRINQINGMYKITHLLWDSWENDFVGERTLRPVLNAIFTETMDMHGRLYTHGRFGHQKLSKMERMTIRFNGMPTVELDYSGLHPRMLYHLEGIDYRGDPYSLWGKDTTGPMRLMAKIYINALINAKSPDAAVSACNRAMSSRTKDGNGRKKGKALNDARRLYDAYRETGLKFVNLLPLVKRVHRRIAHRFGTDKGIHLMRIDSAITLDVLDHFSQYGTPCLSCHDSFIIQKRAKDELLKAMFNFYESRLKFFPVIK